MKNIYILLIAVLMLGCAEEKRNQAQYNFVHRLDTVINDLQDLQVSWLLNKGKGGALPPEDLNQQIEAKKAKLEALLRNPPVADAWNALIVSVRREGASIVVHTSYGRTSYVLKILDPAAKKLAENLRDGDNIQFSGRLMPEGSKTLFGAMVSSVFNVYPTKLVRGDLGIVQNEQLAEGSRSAEEHVIESAKRQQSSSEAEKELKLRIKEICQETILKNLRYPASAYFPKIIKQYEKGSHGNWIYFDVVAAKNELGADIPRRFKCDGQVEGQDVVVKLQYID